MINLKIQITFPDNTSLFCGEIVTTKPDHRGAIQGAFRYAPEYLNHAQAFPLDPVNLPLSPVFLFKTVRASRSKFFSTCYRFKKTT